MRRPIISAFALSLLIACGGGGGDGGGGGGGGIDPRLLRLDEYAAQRLRVLGDPGAGVPAMAETPEAMIPDSGSFDYAGGATIRVEAAAEPLVLYGDAAISVNFGDGTALGQLERFFGITSTGEIADFDGALTVSSADAAGAAPIFSYDGALAGPVDTLLFDGVLSGHYLGDAAEALTAADLEALVMLNGVPVDATLVVVTEVVPPQDGP